MGLSHPNLCQIFEIGEQDGTWFIAMEWVNGITLHQLVRRAVELADVDYAVLARVVAQCAEALHHAHTARDADGRPLCLVHRDVSPHNLMVAYDGRVKLLDFGIAKSTASTHRTEAGVVKGKVCYMAPEQWRSEALDARTDVFALGACLYEVLTGQMAFRRDTQADVMRAICDEPLAPIGEQVEGVPEALAEIAHRALAKDPMDRFQTALEMSEALERFVGSLPRPVNAARVASYTRRLFSSEVTLGPMLERAVRGAQLEQSPMLPPVPELLHDVWPSESSLPARPSLPRLLGAAPLPAPPAMPAPTEPVATPSRPPSRDHARVGAGSHADPYAATGTEVDTVLGCGFDVFEASPVEGRLAHEPYEDAYAELDESTSLLHAPSTFSEAPTCPRPGLAELRAGARTESIQIPLGKRRRLMVALLAASVGSVLGGVLHTSLRGKVPLRRLGTSAPIVVTASAADAAPQVSRVRLVEARGSAHSDPSSAPPAAAAPAAREPEARGAAREQDKTQPAAPKPGRNQGLLSLDTRPGSTVYLGRRVLGSTPLASVVVPRGTLQLKLVDANGQAHQRRILRSKQLKRSAFFDLSKRADPRASRTRKRKS
jgi:serine/threonine-protein kinase